MVVGAGLAFLCAPGRPGRAGGWLCGCCGACLSPACVYACPARLSCAVRDAHPADPNEETNLASTMKDKVSAMQARLGEVRETVYAPNRGELDPKACDANKACGGYWSPWM